MANERATEVAIPDQTSRQAVLPQGGLGLQSASPGAASGLERAAQLDDGSTKIFETAAGVFGQFSQTLGAIADRAATIDGRRSGHKAGLDPEFRPRNDSTLYGEAYDQAALDTARSRLTVEVTGQMNKAFDANRDNPTGLVKALGDIRNGFGKRVIPELQPEFQTHWQQVHLGLVREATRNHLSRVREQQTAALQDDVANHLTTVHQTAFRAGLDPEADVALAGMFGTLSRRLTTKGPDGRPLIDPVTAAKLRREAEPDIARSRILGAFSRLDGTDAKVSFIDQLQKGYQAGTDKLTNLFDPRQYESLVSHLRSEARQESTRNSLEVHALTREVQAQEMQAKRGIPLTPEKEAALKGRIAAIGSPDLVDRFTEAKTTLGIVRELNTLPLTEVEAYADAERRRMVKTGTTDRREFHRLQVVDTWLAEANKQVSADPLGWAAQSGMPVSDLDLTSPDKLAQSLRQRIPAADETGRKYSRETVYMRPQEKQALTAAIRKGGPDMIEISRAIVAGGEDRAHAIFGELSKDAPELAVMGRLQLDGGSDTAIADIARFVQLKAHREFKPEHKPPPERARGVTAQVVGGALGQMDRTAGNIGEAADAIYQLRAQRRTLTAFDTDLYAEALQEAAGQTTDVRPGLLGFNSTRKYGGIGPTYGGRVLIPPGVRQDGFESLVDTIRKDDLDVIGRPYDAQLKELRLSTLRAGRWVSVEGPGRYVISLGEDETGKPRYVYDKDQRPLVVDLGRIMPRLRERRPDLFQGHQP